MTRYAARELCKALLKLFAVKIGCGGLDLRLDLSNTSLDFVGVAFTTDDDGVLLVDFDLACAAELIERGILEFKAELVEITSPPVRIAMSRSISLRRSPKPGALTAAHTKVPLSLLRMIVVRASPSTSSAIMTSLRPAWTICSSIGRISWTLEIFCR